MSVLDQFKKTIEEAYPEITHYPFFHEKTNRKFNESLKAFSSNLGAIWNRSGFTDFSLYNHKDYLIECIWTYLVSSGGALKNMRQYFSDNNIDLSEMYCLDYYNGIGLTTRDLVDMGFKGVSYFNDCKFQVEAAHRILKSPKSRWLPILGDADECKRFNDDGRLKYDVVICLETIEHFKEPKPFTKRLIDLTKTYFVETTSFCSPQHYGHFPKYLVDGKEVSGLAASVKTHAIIRNDFDLVYSGFNGKPRIWKRKNHAK